MTQFLLVGARNYVYTEYARNDKIALKMCVLSMRRMIRILHLKLSIHDIKFSFKMC